MEQKESCRGTKASKFMSSPVQNTTKAHEGEVPIKTQQNSLPKLSYFSP